MRPRTSPTATAGPIATIPTGPEHSAESPPGGSRVAWPLIYGAAFVLTVLVRLVPVLRGGGLRGYGSYDDSVYYASAVGLVHGRLPYRDFLLLQPPGVIVALAPFAALGRLIGEADGLALARLAWMIMGGLTAVGIAMFLRPLGRVAAVVAAAFYALFWPSAMTERATYLEAPQSLLLIAALLLLMPAAPARSPRAQRVAAVLAGVALGFDLTTKIWTLLIVAVLIGWILLRRRFSDLRQILPAMTVAAVAVYLPFFVVAPGRMYQMVVLTQIGRRRSANWVARLADSTGTNQLASGQRAVPVIAAAVVIMVVALILGLLVRRVRPVAVLYALLVGLLMAVPPAFVHYGSLVGVPAAILIGSATVELGRLAGRIPAPGATLLRAALTVIVMVGLTAMAYPQANLHSDHRMPVKRLKRVLNVPGCVTFDTPSPALSLGLVGRDLDRGCPLVVDLGGVGDQLSARAGTSRSHNPAWQRFTLHYLRSGHIAILYRVHQGLGVAPATRRRLDSWPEVAHTHGLEVCNPNR